MNGPLETLPTSTRMDEIDNTKHSSTGIRLKFYRNNFGHLTSSFYYPTGCFALLSMISYLVKPDVVSYCYWSPGFVICILFTRSNNQFQNNKEIVKKFGFIGFEMDVCSVEEDDKPVTN